MSFNFTFLSSMVECFKQWSVIIKKTILILSISLTSFFANSQKINKEYFNSHMNLFNKLGACQFISNIAAFEKSINNESLNGFTAYLIKYEETRIKQVGYFTEICKIQPPKEFGLSLYKDEPTDILSHSYRAGYCGISFRAGGLGLANKDSEPLFSTFLEKEFKKYEYNDKFDILNMCVKSTKMYKISIQK